MDEQIILQEPGVTISSSRILIDGKTFATRNIGSVALTQGGIGYGPIFLGAIGVGFGVNGSALWAVLWLGAAVFLGWQNVSRRTLTIVAGGGETTALETRDKARASRIHDAVANAIAVR